MISLGWTTREYRRNISVLNSLGKNYLASNNSMSKVKSDAIEKQLFEKGSCLFFKYTKCDSNSMCLFQSAKFKNNGLLIFRGVEEIASSRD